MYVVAFEKISKPHTDHIAPYLYRCELNIFAQLSFVTKTFFS